MAFSQSIKRGQIPINCRLCETETIITSKCIECDLLMCIKCKEKIHPKFRNAKNHRIVDIKDIKDICLHTAKVAPEELDFTNIPCHNHSGQISCVFCKTCEQPACPHCISKVHNGHALVDMKEGYKIQLEKLEAIESQVEEVLNEAKYKEQSIKEVKKNEKIKYKDVKKRIQDQNTLLKKAIDQDTNELLQTLNKNWDDLENTILKAKQLAIERQEDLNEKMSLIKNLKESHNTEKIFSEVENMTKSLDIEYNSLELAVNVMPVFIPGEINKFNVGELHQSPSIAKFTVSNCFNTNLNKIGDILFSGDESIWINNSKQKLLQKVKPAGGENLNTIVSCNMLIYSMALTQSNDVLLVTDDSKVKVISHGSNQLMDTNCTTSPLLDVSVHVTSGNKVIVGARNKRTKSPVSSRHFVVVMDIKGKHEVTYEHDNNGEPLFSYPWAITSTRNGNIFVIDHISKNFLGRLVILQQTGDVVNIYKGHPDINNVNKVFKPVRMACTPSDNVIVTDSDRDIVHILNNTGYLIKYCNMNDLGIFYPYSLAFSNSGKLYIGCSRKKGSSEKNAKLYELDISGF